MKHKAVMLLLPILLLLFSSSALADTQQIAVFKIGFGKYNINGMVKTDAAPYIENDRTYLPLRYVAYAMGVGDNSIAWDDASQTAYISRNGQMMSVRVGESEIRVGNRTVPTDAPAEITKDRVMLPLRAVAEAFGCRVQWDNVNNKVTVLEN